jgi:hypothetical protein
MGNIYRLIVKFSYVIIIYQMWNNDNTLDVLHHVPLTYY